MKLITPFGFKFNHDKSFFQVIHRYMQISNFTYFNMLGKFLKRKKSSLILSTFPKTSEHEDTDEEKHAKYLLS